MLHSSRCCTLVVSILVYTVLVLIVDSSRVELDGGGEESRGLEVSRRESRGLEGERSEEV